MRRRSGQWHGWTVLAAGATLALSVNTAEAGLLDVLFGRRPPARQAYYYAPGPGLEVTIQPRAPAPKAKTGNDARRRAARGVETHDREAARASALQTPMEIAGDPNWFLRDETLRRGDIIVRANGALVYEGGRHGARSDDFTSLAKTRLLSKRAKAHIQKLVEVPREDGVEFIVRRAGKPPMMGVANAATPPRIGSTVSAAAEEIGGRTRP